MIEDPTMHAPCGEAIGRCRCPALFEVDEASGFPGGRPDGHPLFPVLSPPGAAAYGQFGADPVAFLVGEPGRRAARRLGTADPT